MSLNDVGLAILTWKAPETLKASLASHEQSGLFGLLQHKSLFFNERGDAECKIAAQYEIDVYGTEENLGIHRGAWAAARTLSTDYLIFLENDITSIKEKDELREILLEAREELILGADVVMLRSRDTPGPDFVGIEKYVKYNGVVEPMTSDSDNLRAARYQPLLSAIRRNKRNEHLSAAPYVEKQPEKKHAEITLSSLGNFLIPSRYAPWTNQPHMIRRSLFLELMEYVSSHPSPRQSPDMQTIETSLRRSGWQDKPYVTCVHSRGCFRHSRIDR